MTNNDRDDHDDYSPDYSPDGRKIVLATYYYSPPGVDDETGLSMIDVGGGNEIQITAPKYRGSFDPSWGSRP